ncbi:MAG: PP2C family protein-serine/threonine phosphatase [Chloroflexota bacterium]
MTERLEVRVAAAKVAKYATSESGDTLEMVERPLGGLSLVLADGQRSGRAAKAISNIVVRKAVALLAEGVRDGAVARAAHDYLLLHRGGKVSAELNIVSIDLVSRTLVVSRNSHCPVLLVQDGQLSLLDQPSNPIGIHRGTRPVIVELPLQPETFLIVFTDGILEAGRRSGQRLDLPSLAPQLLASCTGDPQAVADGLLDRAVAADQGRPADDISVLVVAVLSQAQASDVRRMTVSFPIR